MKENKDKDFELISQIKEGDTSKFRILVDRNKDVSYSLACSILKNEQDAEDALQESFIKAFRGLKSFSFKSSFSTWLYKIVLNTCISKYKSRKKYNHFIDIDSDANLMITDKNTPFNDLKLNERKVVVNKVLDAIKEEESLLLRLIYLADLSIIEIKNVTGFKESKVKVTLHRARKSFQLKFQKIYGYETTLTS